MLRKNKIWQLFAIAGLILTYALLLKYGFMSIREFGLITVTILAATACMEYHRRKLFNKFKQETDRKLKQQADKFHDGLWNMIFSKGWRIEDHVTLLDLDGEFIEIHPSPKYTRTNPRYINKSNGNRKATALNEG